jgi:peptidyl-prolyl cis-trans isomerase B (cyclophilin B)
MELFPELAPQHVQSFLARIRSGFYLGTVFHRAIPRGIIQGGDPLSRDPQQRERYGTGGLFELEAEFNEFSHTRGTVSAVLVPGDPNSAGSQFFICVTDQVQLDGNYTAFGQVVDGMDLVERISLLPTDEEQRVTTRVEIKATFERDRPPPEAVPFSDVPVTELSRYRVVISTNLGDIEVGLHPDVAPRHVRRFLRFAELGLYDGTTFHRVVPGFVIQGGALSTRKSPIAEKYLPLVTPVAAEFNDRKHVRGTVSMARAEDPDSALDSFFIVLEPQEGLDGNYTVFGTVTKGLETVDGISQVPTQGESPLMPVMIEKMTVEPISAE